MMSYSIVAVVYCGNHNADHLSFCSAETRPAIQHRSIQIDMRTKCFRMQTVNFKNVVDQMMIAIPFLFVQLAQQAFSVVLVNGVDPRNGRCRALGFTSRLIRTHLTTVLDSPWRSFRWLRRLFIS
jgi:hypothetical protein